MKHATRVLGALALSTTMAQAGGLDRSGQPVNALFENGSYAELSFGFVDPSVSGTFMTLPSGDMAPSYTQLGFAIKADLSEKLSAALIMDQPFGAKVDYPLANAPYPLATSRAEVKSTGITLLGRYKINDAFSVHAGLRQVSLSGYYDPAGVYTSTYATDSDMAWIVGGAFEKPEIALRVALTYSSGTSHTLDGSWGDVATDMPQSVNLDFQTGIAANTLLFGSIRWADWTETAIVDNIAGTLVDYDQDVLTYSVGVGRKFSDNFSGAVTLGYEKAQGGLASNLSPTDGYVSLGAGGSYTSGNMKVTGGVRYVKLGDATTKGIFADFSGNSAVALGLKVSFSF